MLQPPDRLTCSYNGYLEIEYDTEVPDDPVDLGMVPILVETAQASHRYLLTRNPGKNLVWVTRKEPAMGKLSARKKRVKRTVEIGTVDPAAGAVAEDLDARIEAIQLLVPLGLEAVAEELQRAVMELAGRRYQRKESDQPYRRWGSQRGSVYLGDQKVPVEVPRVRNVDSDTEVALDAYQALQTPRKMDEGLLRKVLKGIATRNYEDCAETVPETFGLSRSSVSRRYVKGTARKLAEFQERSLPNQCPETQGFTVCPRHVYPGYRGGLYRRAGRLSAVAQWGQ